MGLPAGIQMSEEHRRAIGLGMRKAGGRGDDNFKGNE